MNKTKFAYILEITWAIITIITLGISVHSTFTNGLSKSFVFYLLAFVSFFMYYIRRHRRTHA